MSTREWTGAVPKPLAVKLLQVVGVLSALVGAALIALGNALSGEGAWATIYLVLGYNFAIVAPFALLAAWKRPPGLVAGIVALALLLPALPVGPFIVAIIAFFGIKDRDHIRDFYAQGIKRDE